MIIAMWSGPRNLSTAMMRSFAQRSDASVWDEPFYAAYLKLTGLDHPMRREIMEAYQTDPAKVAEQCLDQGDRPIHYQKHMTHHMIEGVPRDWIGQVKNVFLIRKPEAVIASYQAKREWPEFDELGFRQQSELFEIANSQLGETPIVLDADDVRKNPQTALKSLCKALKISFDPSMLSWPKGQHARDGIWGKHWYGSIWNSTQFLPPAPAPILTEPRLRKLAERAAPYFEKLQSYKI